ncbi:hypothetical protein, partial [Desulfobulbus sp.]|uniref:hypothetical protein n=1 Tax=Desulfobulbus sp. TaxID=895 RepID=UPI0027BA1505
HTHRASENLRLFKGFSGYGLTIPFNGHFDEHSEEKSRYGERFLTSFEMTHLCRRGFALCIMLRLIEKQN